MPRRSLARSLVVRFVCHKWSAHSRVRHVVNRAPVLFICMDGGGGGVRGEYINDRQPRSQVSLLLVPPERERESNRQPWY